MRPVILLNCGALDFRQPDIDGRDPREPPRVLAGSCLVNDMAAKSIHVITDHTGPVPVTGVITSDWSDATFSIEIAWAYTWGYGVFAEAASPEDSIRFYATRSFIALDYETPAHKPALHLDKIARPGKVSSDLHGMPVTASQNSVLPIFWRQSPGRGVSLHAEISLHPTIKAELPILLSAIPGSFEAPVTYR